MYLWTKPFWKPFQAHEVQEDGSEQPAFIYQRKNHAWPAWMVMKWLDKERVVVVYLDVSETFVILLLHFDSKDETIWTCTQSEWKTNCAQSVAVNSSKSNWQPIVNGVPWGWLWAWYCLTSSMGTSATKNQAPQWIRQRLQTRGSSQLPKGQGPRFKGTLTGCRNGVKETSWSSAKANINSCICDRITPCSWTSWG